MASCIIPEWAKPGVEVHAWLPHRGNKYYSPRQWHVKIISCTPGIGSGRRNVPKITISWPGRHGNKDFIDWYPEMYDKVEESITISLFYDGILQVIQVEPRTSAVISTGEAVVSTSTATTTTTTASASSNASIDEAVVTASTTTTHTDTSSSVTFTQFCDNFHKANENDVVAATRDARNEDAPADTVCTQCEHEISSGQFWHLHCANCRKPVHAQPWCCGKDSTGAPICLRCKVMLSCPLPTIGSSN